MLGLGWVPTFFFTVSTLGYIVPYIISTSYGHVYFIFPAISDSGVHMPESLVFRELINISGFLSICNIYVRYRQYQLILSALQEPNLEWIKKVNFWCTVNGCIGGIAVTFIANFKSRKAHPIVPFSEYAIHNVAAVVVFFTGLIYCMVQTYISCNMIGYNVNSRTTCYWRCGLTLSVLFNFVVFVIGSVISTRKWDHEQWQQPQEHKLRWKLDDPGYSLHVIGNVAEWLMCFSFLSFSLTFIKEFQKIRLTSDFRGEDEREALMNSLTSSNNFIDDTPSSHCTSYTRQSSSYEKQDDEMKQQR